MCLGRACDTDELQVHRPRPGKGLRRERRLSPRGMGSLRVDVAGSPRSTQTNGNQGPRSQRLRRERGSVPQLCASAPGDPWRSLETVRSSQRRGLAGCFWHPVGRDWGAADPPTRHRSAPSRGRAGAQVRGCRAGYARADSGCG